MRDGQWHNWRLTMIALTAALGLGCAEREPPPPPPLVQPGEFDAGLRDAGLRADVVSGDGNARVDASRDAELAVPDAAVVARFLEACSPATICATGLVCDTTFPRSFCTRVCRSDADCGAAAACDGQYCLPRCAPGARSCDMWGGACLTQTVPGFPPVCLPTCSSDFGQRCSAGVQCDAHTARCTTTPRTQGAPIGAPCTEDAQCLTEACVGEFVQGRRTDFPGGYCYGATYYPGVAGAGYQANCPDGAVLIPQTSLSAGDLGFCYAACRRDSDCRIGYECVPIRDTGACLPIDCARDACPVGTRCETANEISVCTGCTPQCAGRVCGDDGCGGSCGECSASDQCQDGQCQCVAEADQELCGAADAECGTLSVTDRCGVSRSISCGTCSGPETCGAISTHQCGCIPQTDAELCTQRGATCGSLFVTDQCARSRSVECGMCGASQVCRSNECEFCTPSCGTRQCGSNGCGGTCGTCPSGEVCGSAGMCEVDNDCNPVSNTGCPAGAGCFVIQNEETACATAGGSTTFCSAANHCQGGRACLDGRCRKICTPGSDFQCAVDEVCASIVGWSTYGACYERP